MKDARGKLPKEKILKFPKDICSQTVITENKFSMSLDKRKDFFQYFPEAFHGAVTIQFL